MIFKCIVLVGVLAGAYYVLARSKPMAQYQKDHSNDGFQQPV